MTSKTPCTVSFFSYFCQTQCHFVILFSNMQPFHIYKMTLMGDVVICKGIAHL